jgi:UDP-N-acetylmuramoylalanine--D-glutamate ligase
MKFLIFGLGKTGISALRYLQRQGHACVIFDTRSKDSLNSVKSALPENFFECACFFESFPETAWENIDAVVISPGLDPQKKEVKAILAEATKRNIKTTTDLEIFFEAITRIKTNRGSGDFPKIIGITGSNGKSTVTALVYEMLKTAGCRVKIGGNFGIPALDLLPWPSGFQEDDSDYYVLELSSFQLEGLSRPPELSVAALLNITPNHLDRHGDMQTYQRIKERIYENAEIKIINRTVRYLGVEGLGESNAAIKYRFRSFGLDRASPLSFGVEDHQGQEYLAEGQSVLMLTSEIRIQGRHNIENALAALAIVSALNTKFLTPGLEVLKTFEGLSHRCQWIRTLDDVIWINDSKSTTVAATQAALEGLGPRVVESGSQIILVAGGQAKGATFESLKASISKFVKLLILLGQDADQLEKDLQGVVEISHVQSLRDAVSLAAQRSTARDLVLLSPACASLDMFKNYEHRGEVFAEAVHSLSSKSMASDHT